MSQLLKGSLLLLGMAGSVQGGSSLPGPYSFLAVPAPSEYSLQATLEVAGGWSPGATAAVAFDYQDEDHYNAVRFRAEAVDLVQVRQGQMKAWGGTVGWSPQDAGERIEWTLKRRTWEITLLCNGEEVAQAYDHHSPGGRVGTAASTENLHFAEVLLQPTEAVFFTDDFTRAPEDPGVWETLGGTFGPTQVRGEQADKGVPVGANRFARRGEAATGRGLCVTGYWFWDDYRVQAAVQPESSGWVGLAALVQDADNFLAFRWASQAGPNVAQLIQVKAGRTVVLAERPGGYLPGQWYRLSFQAQGGRLVGRIDGTVIAAVENRSWGQGLIGLYLENCAGVRFDDVRAEQVEDFREDFSRPLPGKWQDGGGVWQTHTRTSENSRVTCRTRLEGEETLTWAGRYDWQDYTVGMDVQAAPGSSVGLAFGVRGEHHYHLLKVDYSPLQEGRSDQPQVQLLRRRGDQATCLQETFRPVPAARWNRLKVRLWRHHIQAFINDQQVFEGFDPDLTAGAIGGYAAGPGESSIDNVYLWFPREEDPSPPVLEQFAQEESMAGWARPQGSWSQVGATWWHQGAFFSDTSLSARFPHLAGTDGQALLLIHGEGSDPASGYALTVDVDTVEEEVTFQLLRRGQSRARTVQATSEVPPDSRLRLYRAGSWIIGTLNEAPLVYFFDPDPLSGHRVACQAQGIDMPLEEVQPSCATLIDETFSRAPTDWWAGQGSWEPLARWPCDARWSWLGGTDSETPILWSKRGYFGDLTVEAWVALRMDQPADPEIGYRHPSDLNLTLCANGRDLDSGYSCIFAGWNNSRTALLRRTEVKAATEQVKMDNPTRLNLDFQRHWYYLRVEKEGNRIRYSVDGHPPLEFEDPEPLSGGQIALWTAHGNGLMVARVRIGYEQATEIQPRPWLPTPAPLGPGGWQVLTGPPVQLVSDFEEGGDGWTHRNLPEGPYLTVEEGMAAQGRKSLRVTNSVAGGHFTLTAGLTRFDAAQFPRLAFAYRLDPTVKINWYLKFRGKWHVLGFTAPEQPGAGVVSLGAVEGVVADGQWHEAEVDLLARLRKEYGNSLSSGDEGGEAVPIERLSLSSPNEDYLRSGIGGNPLGATYHLDHVRLIGAKDTTPEQGATTLRGDS